MGKSKHFTVNQQLIDRVTADNSSPDRHELDDILAKATCDEELTPREVNSLTNVMGAADFPELGSRVLEVASDVRKCVYHDNVVVMAPIEVGNKCVSDCDFCGWKTGNQDMMRSRVPAEIVIEQARYLINKGIYSIELVCGDDPQLVRDEFPTLIQEVRKLFPEGVKGRIQVCTMALTSKQYENLKTAGADGIIVWQETYDKAIYDSHITKGPKAHGIREDWKVDKNGDGFTFRLQSQDRALEAGLEIALGTMLGLNPDLKPEILSTILHARHLIAREINERGVNENSPLIVGMPTWNNITTPRADKRPAAYREPTDIFPYIAAVYFLSLPKKKAWIFPNCRVPMKTQIEALQAGGVFTSTEVKLGPAGYMPAALREATLKFDTDGSERIKRLMSEHLGTEFPNLDALQSFLDEQEQFLHHYGSHHDFKTAFHAAGLNIAPETSIQPHSTLERIRDLYDRRWTQRFATGVQAFIRTRVGTPTSRRRVPSTGTSGK
jgi:hypothetical protein